MVPVVRLYFISCHVLWFNRGTGAIYSVISFMACVAPRAKFLVFGIIPVPAWGCVTGLFAYDFFNAVTEQVSQPTLILSHPMMYPMMYLRTKSLLQETGISEISHLAGILSGLAYFIRLTGRFPTF